jgi:hypothetical protein
MPPTEPHLEAEYAVLLDAVAPLPVARADHRTWEPGSWGRLLDIADWHRLSPALFKHLSAVGGAPEAVLSGLQRAYLANAARGMFIRGAIDDVISALSAAEIECLLLKGAALVETVYGDPAEREMLDIDLLIADGDVARATGAVTSLGYSALTEPSGPGTTSLAPPLEARKHHEEALVEPHALVAVELHRQITTAEESGRLDLSGLWDRAGRVPATGHRVPSAGDLLIHVCFHFTRNRLGGSAHRRNTGGALAQILDMQRLIAAEQIDWDVFVRTSRDFSLATRVFLALFSAAELGVPVPAQTLRQLCPQSFDVEVGRRLVALRVLRAGDHMPVRSMRWMLAPSREALRRGWNADPNATLSLARAYMRRARAHVPEARSALAKPREFVQDRRLNRQIEALGERT